MNSENKGERHDPTPKELTPFPPEGMDLLEYLDLKEKAKSYLRIVRNLYVKLAFVEEDPERKEKFENEKNRHTALLKSMKWMDVDVAEPIVAEYPELIRQLRKKEEQGNA